MKINLFTERITPRLTPSTAISCTKRKLYVIYMPLICSFSGKSLRRGPGSSVGIATDHGLDGPGSNPGGDEIFRPSRPVLGPTQPPVKWVPCLSKG